MDHDLYAPDAEFTPCHAFGGGWLRPRTEAGWDFVRRHLGAEPGDNPPHPNGFIVEPYDLREMAEWAEVEGLAVTTDSSNDT